MFDAFHVSDGVLLFTALAMHAIDAGQDPSSSSKSPSIRSTRRDSTTSSSSSGAWSREGLPVRHRDPLARPPDRIPRRARSHPPLPPRRGGTLVTQTLRGAQARRCAPQSRPGTSLAWSGLAA
jgi:hypothetical protein